MTYFKKVDWLLERLGAENTVIVDTRYLLTEPETGRKSYEEAHIPGAYYADLSHDLSGPKRPDGEGGRHPLPEPEVLAAFLGRIGIGNQTTVVAYDNQGGAMASRLRWLLEWMGHEGQVYVLEGGFTAWQAADYPVSLEEPEVVAGVIFEPALRDGILVSRSYVKESIGKDGIVIIDSREAPRYRGEVEPMDPAAGHIPGAINHFWVESRHVDGVWKSPEEQAERFAALSKDDEIIVYCGSGVTATPNFFALQEAGFKNVKLYAGSWSDWSSDVGNPVAKGEE
ncbi:3-mercaptopyruvate sulfurtransferase [Paenibacillus sp. BIHB 4019]|uniref:3-mercaptopyruvate sulfurtransferase n=1 Tax=Paenibacillus sp. BIHB 4019 TaxID=1870819 RepID=A0A1B2DEB6_9BACL|nr:sulfurtransferase [Paenibacillus sp. BIHB 4019]ANY66062.1 3-mercaptopyruvate sulfurtransferase [Paenibacillus sp. BIHB 4019]